MAIKITWNEFLNLDDSGPVDEIITTLSRIESTFNQSVKNIAADNEKLKKSMKGIADEAETMIGALELMNAVSEENQKTFGETAKKAEQMAKAEVKLAETLNENTKAMEEMSSVVDKVSKSKKELEKQTKAEEGSLTALKKELSAAVKEYENMGNSVDNSIKEAGLNRIKTLARAVNDGNKEVREAKKVIDVAAGSYNELSKQVNEAKKRLKEMEGGFSSNSKEVTELKTFIKDGSDQLKEFDKSLGDNQREVGNYGLAVEMLDQRFGGLAGNVQNVGKELMMLATNPFLLVIATFVTAILTLTAGIRSFFTTTGEGEDVAARQGAAWGQFMNVLKMGFADIGKGVMNFFEDVGGLPKVLDKVTGYIHNWVKSAMMIPIALFGMGEDVDKFFENIRKRFKDTVDDAVELADQMDELDARIREHIVKEATDELKYSKLVEASKNKVLYSDQQRLKFLQEAVAIQNHMAEESIAIEKVKLAQLQQRIALQTKDPTDDQLNEIAEQTAAIIRLEAQLFNDRKRNTAQISALHEEIEKAERDRINRRILAEQELNKLLINENIKTAQEELKNNNLTFEQQKSILEGQMQQRLALMEIEREQAIQIATSAAEERIRSEGKVIADHIGQDEALKKELIRIQEKYNLDSTRLYDDLLDTIDKTFLKTLEQGFKNTYNQLSIETNRALSDLNKEVLKGGMTWEQYEEMKRQIILDGNVATLNAQLDYLAEQIKAYEDDANMQIELAQKVADVKRQLSDMVTKHQIDNMKKEEKEHEEFNKRLVEFADQAAGEIMGLLDSSFAARTERNVAHLEGELAKEEEAKNRRIEIVGEDAQARALIEQDFANKQKVIQKQIADEKRKQAIFQKGLDASSVVISTAKGIATAVAESPLTFGLPWSAFVGVIGALQLATILARPIPQFYKGTESAPGGLAWVAEHGREIGITPSGEINIYNKKQVADLEKGTKIIPNWKSESLLRDAQKYGDGYLYDQLGLTYRDSSDAIVVPPAHVDLAPVSSAIDKSTATITAAIKAQPQDVFDEKGYRRYERSENGRVLRLDNKYKIQ